MNPEDFQGDVNDIWDMLCERGRSHEEALAIIGFLACHIFKLAGDNPKRDAALGRFIEILRQKTWQNQPLA